MLSADRIPDNCTRSKRLARGLWQVESVLLRHGPFLIEAVI